MIKKCDDVCTRLDSTDRRTDGWNRRNNIALWMHCMLKREKILLKSTLINRKTIF